MRNLGEYQGDLDVDERLVTDLIVACQAVADKVRQLGYEAVEECRYAEVDFDYTAECGKST